MLRSLLSLWRAGTNLRPIPPASRQPATHSPLFVKVDLLLIVRLSHNPRPIPPWSY